VGWKRNGGSSWQSGWLSGACQHGQRGRDEWGAAGARTAGESRVDTDDEDGLRRIETQLLRALRLMIVCVGSH